MLYIVQKLNIIKKITYVNNKIKRLKSEDL